MHKTRLYAQSVDTDAFCLDPIRPYGTKKNKVEFSSKNYNLESKNHSFILKVNLFIVLI